MKLKLTVVGILTVCSVNLFVIHEVLKVLFITEGIYSSYIIDIIVI